MSQCYELLIASQPIHILMYNPSSLIGPSTPNMGSGEDETLSNPCSSPTQPTLSNPCNQCKRLSQLSFSIAALSYQSLFRFLSISPAKSASFLNWHLPPCLCLCISYCVSCSSSGYLSFSALQSASLTKLDLYFYLLYLCLAHL